MENYRRGNSKNETVLGGVLFMKKSIVASVVIVFVLIYTSLAFPQYTLSSNAIGSILVFFFPRETAGEPQSSVAGTAELIAWNTSGNSGTETIEPPTETDPNIATANLTLGAGVTPAANANRFGGNAWFDAGDTSPTTLAQSVAGNDYIQFVVTPNAGFMFTPTSFDFIWDRSGTGPTGVTLRSSADGFTADLGSVTGLPSSISPSPCYCSAAPWLWYISIIWPARILALICAAQPGS